MQSPNRLPSAVYSAAEKANSIAAVFASQGRNPSELFIAFAGLVAGKDERLARECLTALAVVIDDDASGESASPRVFESAGGEVT